MSSHPLITERAMAFSPQLAASIGLNEAIMLTWLNDMMLLQGQQQLVLNNDTVRQQLPFWHDQQIRITVRSLHEKGLLQLASALFPDDPQLVISFTQNDQANSQVAEHTPNYQTAPIPQHTQQPMQARQSAQQITHNTSQQIDDSWQPAAATLARLQQHGITDSFCWANMDEFLLQAQEKGRGRNDWNTQFFRHMKNKWVYQQTDAFKKKQSIAQDLPFSIDRKASSNNTVDPHQRFQVTTPSEAQSMAGQWSPSSDAVQILQRSGIEAEFIQDAVAEFVLYWQERGDAHKTWSTKFIQHVRQQWARFQSSEQHSTVPTRMNENWQPSSDCFDILVMAHIDGQFAQQLLPEFILYWKDSNQMMTSWNSKFLQYVKQKWGQRLTASSSNTGQGANYGNKQATAESGYTTAEASLQRLSDTSWAD